jgi:microcystin-dependent protein
MPGMQTKIDVLIPLRFFLKRFVVVAVVLVFWNSAVLAQQPNAWQINDNSGFPGVTQYVTNLTAKQVAAANANGWRMSLLSRIEADVSNPASHAMAFGDGTRRFYIYFDLDGAGNLTAQLLSSSNATYTMTLPAPDVTKYHLHEMIYDPATSFATYRFDGKVIAAWAGNVSTLQSNQVMWGADSSSGMGTMDYHRVEFDINGQGPIAVYDAGFQGAPPTAPSPTNQGWARVVSGFPNEIARSPDNEFIHPIVVTSNAVSLHPGQATLTASVNPNGLPAVYSFDYGLTTAYGNSTAQYSVGSATDFVSVSTLITGLPRGVTNHFRAVASNSGGSVYDGDMNFSGPQGATVTTTGVGGGQPVDIRQPSLVLNYIICTNGNYPDSSTMQTPFLGEVRLFAGNFAPAGWAFCQGQLIPTNNLALYSILHSTYGGQGGTNFGLPDARGRTIVGVGQGSGLSSWILGERQGREQWSFSAIELPVHRHSLPPLNGLVTGPAGNSIPHPNGKPGLALSCLFALQGNYPYSTQPTAEPFIGQMPFFAGSFAGDKYTLASGQTLGISQNTPIYNVVGTNYGGDGATTFAIPDIRSRSAMGSGQGPGLSARIVAQKFGEESVTISTNQMPAHQHVVPWPSPYSFQTGLTGTNPPQPLTLIHPALVLRYIIATNGELPSLDIRATNRMIGEIQLFAGTNVPSGWMACDGQLLQVERPTAGLFGVLSNFYGGDGVSTFALPDLRGRFAVGSSNGQPGAVYGAEVGALALNELPVHTHSAPALDFDSWITSLGVSGPNAAFDADADGDGVKNGFEWATGTNPTNAQSFGDLTISSATNFVDVQFIRETNATDVKFILQRTTNVANPSWFGVLTNSAGVWSNASIAQEIGSNNLVNVHLFDSVTNNPSATYRLNVTFP